MEIVIDGVVLPIKSGKKSTDNGNNNNNNKQTSPQQQPQQQKPIKLRNKKKDKYLRNREKAKANLHSADTILLCHDDTPRKDRIKQASLLTALERAVDAEEEEILLDYIKHMDVSDPERENEILDSMKFGEDLDYIYSSIKSRKGRKKHKAHGVTPQQPTPSQSTPSQPSSSPSQQHQPQQYFTVYNNGTFVSDTSDEFDDDDEIDLDLEALSYKKNCRLKRRNQSSNKLKHKQKLKQQQLAEAGSFKSKLSSFTKGGTLQDDDEEEHNAMNNNNDSSISTATSLSSSPSSSGIISASTSPSSSSSLSSSLSSSSSSTSSKPTSIIGNSTSSSTSTTTTTSALHSRNKPPYPLEKKVSFQLINDVIVLSSSSEEQEEDDEDEQEKQVVPNIDSIEEDDEENRDDEIICCDNVEEFADESDCILGGESDYCDTDLERSSEGLKNNLNNINNNNNNNSLHSLHGIPIQHNNNNNNNSLHNLHSLHSLHGIPIQNQNNNNNSLHNLHSLHSLHGIPIQNQSNNNSSIHNIHSIHGLNNSLHGIPYSNNNNSGIHSIHGIPSQNSSSLNNNNSGIHSIHGIHGIHGLGGQHQQQQQQVYEDVDDSDSTDEDRIVSCYVNGSEPSGDESCWNPFKQAAPAKPRNSASNLPFGYNPTNTYMKQEPEIIDVDDEMIDISSEEEEDDNPAEERKSSFADWIKKVHGTSIVVPPKRNDKAELIDVDNFEPFIRKPDTRLVPPKPSLNPIISECLKECCTTVVKQEIELLCDRGLTFSSYTSKQLSSIATLFDNLILNNYSHELPLWPMSKVSMNQVEYLSRQYGIFECVKKIKERKIMFIIIHTTTKKPSIRKKERYIEGALTNYMNSLVSSYDSITSSPSVSPKNSGFFSTSPPPTSSAAKKQKNHEKTLLYNRKGKINISHSKKGQKGPGKLKTSPKSNKISSPKSSVSGMQHGDVVDQHRPPIPESNVGNMLLKKMGWSGGGLGITGQGLDTPIQAVVRKDRLGLGL